MSQYVFKTPSSVNPQGTKTEVSRGTKGTGNAKTEETEISTGMYQEYARVRIDENSKEVGVVESTVDETEVGLDTENKPSLAPTNTELYKTEGEQIAGEIYNPLIANAEAGKEAIDLATKMQVEGIQEAIPYVTRQFEAYQAKTGFSTGMQGRMSNQLVMDIATQIGDVYQEAELSKYAVDSKIAEYQSAMAQGAYDIATQKYNEALSRAQFMSDYLGAEYVQPEIQYIYDQMTVAQKVMSDEGATEEEKTAASTTLSGLETTLKDLGYSGDIGEGLQTYQQQVNALEEFYQEAIDLYEAGQFEVQYNTQLQTVQAWQEIRKGTTDPVEILTMFPGADVEQILEWLDEEGTTDPLAGLTLTTEEDDTAGGMY